MLLLPGFLHAQLDTILYVPTVEIERVQIRIDPIGSSQEVWGKKILEENKHLSLGDFLQREGNVYIKLYGGNSLSTLSVRGSSASQTLVLWNGLPIQSAMLGLLDLSLLPLNFNDKVSLQAGGNSSAWGSGAIGGVLSFENSSDFNNKIGIQYHSSIGSFGNINQQLRFKFGTKHFQSDTRLVYQKAENDIVYRPDPSLDRLRQEHAAFKQAAILQSFYIKPNQYHELGIHAWLQQSQKELPPTLTQTNSEASQEDRFQRFLMTYTYKRFKHKIAFKAAYFKEKQQFEDAQIRLIANNDFNTALAELSYSYSINVNHAVELINTNNYTSAESKSYDGQQYLLRTALAGVYKFEKKRLAFKASLRGEVANGRILLPTTYLGAEFKLNSNVLLKAKITRDFRLPTLNDLFWEPGGNPDLLPEQGWSQEIGVVYDKKIKAHRLTLSQTAYNRNIDNWIFWAPSSTNFYWSASNIAKVWSWGTESRIAYTYQKPKWSLNYIFTGNYTSSTYRVSLDLPKIEKGDQLFYTPEYQIRNEIQFTKGPILFKYQHLFFGQTTGANDEIPAYQIGNIQLAYRFTQNKVGSLLFLNLNNIYNKTYIVVERRPVPGVNYQIGININFNN